MKREDGKLAFRPCLSKSHLNLGQKGEDFARSLLLSLGYRFLEKNWRSGHLEIDLIFEDGEEIVFVEVKTRSSDIFGGASEAVTTAKKSRLLRAAQLWLCAHDFWERPCRFDVVCLTRRENGFNAEHYINAFVSG